jgi:energy-coupling factor transporter ATP-binding protein EcfA2
MEKGEQKTIPPVYVRIKNFQSIEDIEVEVKGFTCITGKTNIGKSAFVRAIAGALQNSPVGGDVRVGSKFCSVTLRSDGWGFTWEKGEKGGGTYYLDDGKILDKIGQGQIIDISNMGFHSIEIGDEEIQPWLAPQWEPIFLLNKSGPAVTDFISDVSRLSVLQDAIILSLRGKKKSLDGVKLRDESLAKLKVRELAVGGLDNLLKLGQELDDQAKSIDEYEKKIAFIEDLLRRIMRSQARIQVLSGVGVVRIPQPPAPALLERIHTLHTHWVRCETAAKRVRILKPVLSLILPNPPLTEMENLRKVAKHARIFDLIRTVDVLKDIRKVKIPQTDAGQDLERIRAAEIHYRRIQKAAADIQALSGNITIPQRPPSPKWLIQAEALWKIISSTRAEEAKLEAELAQINEDLKKVKEELAKIPSCAACGRPMTKKHSHSKSSHTKA